MTDNVTQRYITMDALRGFAVMGILLINIMPFGMPDLAFISPAIYGDMDAANVGTWITTFVLVDGKMRGLFTLLFGASMMLVIERAEANGQSPAAVHYSRIFWLALFGLAHFFFIWWGDILFLYAGAGAVIYFMRNWEARTLIKWGVIIYAIGSLLLMIGMTTMLTIEIQASAANADPEALARYQRMIDDIGLSDAATMQQVALYLGSYGDILTDRINQRGFLPLQNLILAPFETIPIMMIGMGLYKNRFLLGERDRAVYWRWGLWLTGIGLALMFMLVGIAFAKDFQVIWMFNITQAWAAPSRLLMTLGYIALLILLIQNINGSAILERVAAAGRAAFTNYLGTSIICTTLFYGYGFALFGELSRPMLYGVVLGVWALMLLWSKPWLDRFRYGPLEWLWRSLARRELQPLRK